MTSSQKQTQVPSRVKSRQKRRRQSAFDDSDDENPNAHAFPAALLNEVDDDDDDDDDDDSPTKKQRKIAYSRPPVRKGSGLNKRGGRAAGDLQDEHGNVSPHMGDPDEPDISVTHDVQLDLYIEALRAGVVEFSHIHSGRIFAVVGWDEVKREAKDRWYHLEYQTIEGEVHTSCTCRISGPLCVHRRYATVFTIGDEYSGAEGDPPPAKILSQRIWPSQGVFTEFSVEAKSMSEFKSRAIVSHLGYARDDKKSWKCYIDGEGDSSHCPHILEALTLIPERYEESLTGPVIPRSDKAGSVTERIRGPGTTVSYLPIRVPWWARLPMDPILYPDRGPFVPPNSDYVFRLNGESSCRCSAKKRTLYDPQKPTIVLPCTVYTTAGLHNLQIELQRCPTCDKNRRRYIGPDLRGLGVFNWNNRTLVCHEILDDYTSNFTSSETTFTTWVLLVSRRWRYSRFMGEDLFRAIWFSYAFLQRFDNDMICRICGPNPETVIWDGVTVGFGRNRLKDSLRPPTEVHPDSMVRKGATYDPKQQLIANPQLRKRLRSVLEGPNLDFILEASQLPTPVTPLKGTASEFGASRQAWLVKGHLETIAFVTNGLRSVCPELAALFEKYFGAVAYASGRRPSPAWKNFFVQIAAEESVLQMVDAESMLGVLSFLRQPTVQNAGRVVSVPAFYKVLKHREGADDIRLIAVVLKWVYEEARKTMKRLTGRVPDSPLRIDHVAPFYGWFHKTGCLYSMPQIRHRPKYPSLRDRKKETNEPRGDRCGKYYSTYGKKKLTGGLMVCWCSHSICYGFHSIPQTEGRDDVFSAMITRWPVAPKTVIYDFACALGPYCMLREPVFFGKTRFLIDYFHSNGHTKCSPACFLSQYASVDTRLAAINSSAGECGNKGLGRIRKGVSYMGQDRAVIYTKVFLSVWNRNLFLDPKKGRGKRYDDGQGPEGRRAQLGQDLEPGGGGRGP
ncbi:hypothetical protein FA13DRAFT_1636845 [Coprinellus micaceus]|uniref:SWIM-type domain-containing protein n=1 Tax=Coprinellus micaceus TaxID=71717 RepID=A0A4Y7SVJ9_COPMI|nr:hypothetical protein FA13DRAFT_1636845 [Coprinellus micaceus]